jgi:hypothetical protein
VAASVNLSGSDKYTSIAKVGGQLVLYGPTGYPTTGRTCSSATVDPSTLALTGLVSASCANPATEGRLVLPVFTVERGAAWSAGSAVPTVTVQISHLAAVIPSLQLGPVYMAGSPGFRLGPVVMRFPDESSSWPVWAYGDGYLWLYGPTTRNGSELLRISSSTGAVVKQLGMPDVLGPILAVDNDGLWMAPPAVYHVGLRASAAVPVFTLSAGEYAAWMVAAGHSVWFAVSSHGKGWAVWQLIGNGAVQHSHGKQASLDNEVELPGGASTMVGDASGDLWTAVPNASGTQQVVIRVGLSSPGSFTTIASITPGYASPDDLLNGAWQALAFNGSVYLLDPPVRSPKSPNPLIGFTALYKINLVTGAVSHSPVS